MISLFTFIKEILPDSREYHFKGELVKQEQSVIIDPYTRLPDINNFYYNAEKLILEILQLIDVVIS